MCRLCILKVFLTNYIQMKIYFCGSISRNLYMNKKIIIKIHVCSLILTLLSLASKAFFDVGLIYEADLILKIIVALTGLTLFFYYLQPFKKINFYFSIYAISACLLMVSLILRGVTGGLLASVVLFPVYPDQLEFQQDHVRIYRSYQGFMAACCRYEIREVKMLIFEKKYGRLDSEGKIDFANGRTINDENEIRLSYISGAHEIGNSTKNEIEVIIKK